MATALFKYQNGTPQSGRQMTISQIAAKMWDESKDRRMLACVLYAAAVGIKHIELHEDRVVCVYGSHELSISKSDNDWHITKPSGALPQEREFISVLEDGWSAILTARSDYLISNIICLIAKK